MTRPDCERYLQDPEANAGHLETCAECRAFFETLDAPVEHRPMTVDALPLASWEGASHRPWRLVISAALSVIAFVVMFFTFTGVSPRVVASALPPLDVLLDLPQVAGGFIHNAPSTWRLVIAILFFIVNAVLYLLLRRAPRGIDA
ncbi:MAG TPA: hypothetical protein VMU84_10950 [Thermoanaerobaculia bacterium]|nr:hypothetical protein [Thermoanaerobaculia bacterium]